MPSMVHGSAWYLKGEKDGKGRDKDGEKGVRRMGRGETDGEGGYGWKGGGWMEREERRIERRERE